MRVPDPGTAEIVDSVIASILAIVLITPIRGAADDGEELDEKQSYGWQASATLIELAPSFQEYGKRECYLPHYAYPEFDGTPDGHIVELPTHILRLGKVDQRL
jgi:hypothetical protein